MTDRPRMPLAALLAALCGLPFAAAAPVPKPQAEADQLLARVRIDNLGSALAQPAVAKELDLTDEQKGKLDELTDGVVAKLVAKVKAAQARNNGDLEDTLDLFTDLGGFARETDEAGLKVLTAAQVRRLKQIQLQKDGPAALLGRHAVRALDLSADQEGKLADELAKLKRVPMLEELLAMSVNPGNQPNQAAGVQKVLAKHAAEVDAVRDAMLKVLTTEQRATWAKMTGEPLPTADLVKAATPFGDGKLMKGVMDAEANANAAPAPPPPLPVEKK